MPIRPENRSRYPAGWKAISYGIRFDRAKGCCEWCGAKHGEAHPETGSTVVLTTAHLDHTPENCHPKNLAALCQRCHLTYDAPLHRDNRKFNADEKAKQAALFDWSRNHLNPLLDA